MLGHQESWIIRFKITGVSRNELNCLHCYTVSVYWKQWSLTVHSELSAQIHGVRFTSRKELSAQVHGVRFTACKELSAQIHSVTFTVGPFLFCQRKAYLNINTWENGLRRWHSDVVNGTDHTEVSADQR